MPTNQFEPPGEVGYVSPVRRAAQFSLAHLLGWMSATCFVFAFQQWRLNVGERTDDEPFRWVFNIRLCLFGPLDGACYAGLGLMLLCRLRGIPTFPQQPGHWFLIVRGIALLINDSVDLAMYVGQQH